MMNVVLTLTVCLAGLATAQGFLAQLHRAHSSIVVCPSCTDAYDHRTCNQTQACHHPNDVCQFVVHLADKNRIEYHCRGRHACNHHHHVHHCSAQHHEACRMCCPDPAHCGRLRDTFFANFSSYSTAAPATPASATQKPTTQVPTTPKPTTQVPTTQKPKTPKPTTQKPTTPKPTTQKPTTPKPTTQKPTTSKPTTQKPTTPKPTTPKPTTPKPTTQIPTTQKPTTQKPTTQKPTTPVPTTPATSTAAPITTPSPQLCYVCGDRSSQTPCTIEEIAFPSASRCPTAQPYCMSYVQQKGREVVEITKGCMSRDECRSEWWDTTRNNPSCTNIDLDKNQTLTCSFCCLGEDCNLALQPHPDTLVKF